MPRNAKVKGLPKEVKAWLDNALVDGNFSGYEALAAELKQRGYTVSKSSLHRYGQTFEERLCALRTATEQARAVVQASPDDEGVMNDALQRLVQERLFTLLTELHVDPKEVDITKLTRSIAELGRATVAQKKWQLEARQKALADAAKAAGEAAKSAGLTDEAAASISQKILGIKG